MFRNMIERACVESNERGHTILEYMRELLERDDSKATIELHYEHMQDLLMLTSGKSATSS